MTRPPAQSRKQRLVSEIRARPQQLRKKWSMAFMELVHSKMLE